MIKVEDTISRVIICFLTLLFLFYGFMFTGAESATAFIERLGTSSGDIDANHLQLISNLGLDIYNLCNCICCNFACAD